jgi:hypothetical protein
MPDIQTEMQKILQAWETPEVTEQPPKDTAMFTPTTNTSRTTFELVRDDPGLPKKEYIRKLEAMGHKKASTSSLLSQMLRQGMLWEGTSGGLHPNAKEYAPLKPAKTFAKQQGIKLVPRKTKTFKVKTPKPSKQALAAAAEAMGGINMLVEPIHTRVYKSKIETILDDISLSDAHELYRKLHQYFGGLPK